MSIPRPLSLSLATLLTLTGCGTPPALSALPPVAWPAFAGTPPPRPGLPQPPDVCPGAWLPTGAAPTAPLSLSFANQLNPEFVLRRVTVFYDGVLLCKRTAAAGLPLEARLVALSGPGSAGVHVVHVFVDLDGNADLSLRGYRFEIRSSHELILVPGKPLAVSVVAFLKDLSRPLEERPAVKYVESSSP